MKWLPNVSCIFFAGLLLFARASAQTLSRYTTTELLSKAKINGDDFINSYPEIQLNYALPLIDSMAAVELARLSHLNRSNYLLLQYPDYAYAIGIQCRDDSLQQMFLSALLEYDKLCNDPMISKNDYVSTNANKDYEYSNMLTNAMLKQIQKDDTNFLKIAIREFELWVPFTWGFFDTIARPGMHQLSLGKRKFNPCLLASPVNGSFWAYSIYLVTGKEEYGSANEQMNTVYKKSLKLNRGRKDPDERKDFVRLGKTNNISLTNTIDTLDSFDFETVPALIEKFDKTRKKDTWQIKIYTHENKGLLFLYYSEKANTGFSKRYVGEPSLYLMELTSPLTLQLTNIDYRERYY